MSDSTPTEGPQRVAVVIAAHNARDVISSTVRACNAIPDVDLVVVVDDGSDDDTAAAARGGGAVVVRHSVTRGRASALETGVKVVAMRDRVDWPARHLLFLDQDLSDSAVEAAALVEALNAGVADCAIGAVDRHSPLRARAEKSARATVWGVTGWLTTDPLSTDRALTREAVNAIMPFSNGPAVDVAMTVDLIAKGLTVVEIPCDFEHLSRSAKVERRRIPRPGDIWWTLRAKRLGARRVARAERLRRVEQGVGIPYSVNEVHGH